MIPERITQRIKLR